MRDNSSFHAAQSEDIIQTVGFPLAQEINKQRKTELQRRLDGVRRKQKVGEGRKRKISVAPLHRAKKDILKVFPTMPVPSPRALSLHP
jgi:hypothetical protein